MFKRNPLIWLISASFVQLQFFLQLSSGIVIDVIRHEIHLSALSTGLLSAFFYVIYTLLQIPAGMLCDRRNPRPILAGCALLCGLGCLVFASSHSLFGFYIGRGMIAIGSAFSFVCFTHLVREHYPRQLFGLLIGVAETLSFLVAIIGMLSLASVISHWGWRSFINMSAILAGSIAYLCWRFIPDQKIIHPSQRIPYKHQLQEVLAKRALWINGSFIGLTFMLVPVFGALWAPPFLQAKLHCSLSQASVLDALFILGVSCSCPLFGYFSAKVKETKALILSACVATALVLFLILYIPSQSIEIMAVLLLILGLCSGSYILGYTFANQFSPSAALSTSTGMTNSLALLSTPILQPLIGYLLDTLHKSTPLISTAYQKALTLLPCCILVAAFLIFCLPALEKQQHAPVAEETTPEG